MTIICHFILTDKLISSSSSCQINVDYVVNNHIEQQRTSSKALSNNRTSF